MCHFTPPINPPIHPSTNPSIFFVSTNPYAHSSVCHFFLPQIYPFTHPLALYVSIHSESILPSSLPSIRYFSHLLSVHLLTSEISSLLNFSFQMFFLFCMCVCIRVHEHVCACSCTHPAVNMWRSENTLCSLVLTLHSMSCKN